MVDSIAVEPRLALGKQAAKLRRAGIVPANIYGRGQASVSVQLPSKEAQNLLKSHGLNNLINLNVQGEALPRPVVVRSVDRHPLTRELRHIDFYQVDLKRAIQAAVPVTLVGDAPAVKEFGGILLTGATEITVEALPADLPSSIEVSIEGLKGLDAQVSVGDVRAPSGVTILSAADVMLVRIVRPRVSAADDTVVEGEAEIEATDEAKGASAEKGDGDDAEGASEASAE